MQSAATATGAEARVVGATVTACTGAAVSQQLQQLVTTSGRCCYVDQDHSHMHVHLLCILQVVCASSQHSGSAGAAAVVHVIYIRYVNPVAVKPTASFQLSVPPEAPPRSTS